MQTNDRYLVKAARDRLYNLETFFTLLTRVGMCQWEYNTTLVLSLKSGSASNDRSRNGGREPSKSVHVYSNARVILYAVIALTKIWWCFYIVFYVSFFPEWLQAVPVTNEIVNGDMINTVLRMFGKLTVRFFNRSLDWTLGVRSPIRYTWNIVTPE